MRSTSRYGGFRAVSFSSTQQLALDFTLVNGDALFTGANGGLATGSISGAYPAVVSFSTIGTVSSPAPTS
jgi:hypothetical protein